MKMKSRITYLLLYMSRSRLLVGKPTESLEWGLTSDILAYAKSCLTPITNLVNE